MKCPKCNQSIIEPLNFCPFCGSLLPQHKELPMENVNLTFVRADLSGFTSLSEKLAPEEVMGILRKIFSDFKVVISSYKGMIYQVIGDEIVGIFGLNKQSGFAFHMAILAIEDMFKKLDAFNRDYKPKAPIGLKVGAELDRASIHNFRGSLQNALIVADGFKKSLILQKNAENDTALVGENLYQATKSFFEFVYYGEFIEDTLSIKAYKFVLK